MEEEIPRAGAALDNAHRAARQIVLELRSSGAWTRWPWARR